MTIEQIRKMAEKEAKDSPGWMGQEVIKLILVQQKAHPNGTDVQFPKQLTAEVIATCDEMGIPAYRVVDGCVAVAFTYTQLLDFMHGR